MVKLRRLGDPAAVLVRPINRPKVLQVDASEDGLPQAVYREGWPDWRPVVRVQDRWRIDDGWWRVDPISRLYFVLVLKGDVLFTCFHDLIDDFWAEQRDA